MLEASVETGVHILILKRYAPVGISCDAHLQLCSPPSTETRPIAGGYMVGVQELDRFRRQRMCGWLAWFMVALQIVDMSRVMT